MNLRPLIDDVVCQAEDVLGDCRNRLEARTTLGEFVELEYPRLVSADRRLIAAHVLSVLEDDGFFGERFVDSFDPDASDSNEDED